MFRTALISIFLICSATSADTPVLNEDFKLLASDGASGDLFGYSVSISSDGSTAIVGAAYSNDNGYGTGSAYIYELVKDVWQETKLLASDGAYNDLFGLSVSISSDGTIAIVGARYDDDNASNSGSAYIYELVGGVWQETKLTASDGASGDHFGYSVSISSDGTTAIVGAFHDDDNGSNSGSAYIYELVGGVWEETKLLASDGAGTDMFGISVSISSDGSTAIVGAHTDDDNGFNSGSAYIYELIGGVWEETKLVASDGASGDDFGSSVSISGDGTTAIVGAANSDDDDNGSQSGSAYIYELVGGVWEETKLVASDGASTDFFGISVSISSDGSTAIVGAYFMPFFADGNGSDSGSAYIYELVGGVWQETKLLASDGESNDLFGWSVSISSDGSTALVGTRGDDDNGSNSGSAYIFYVDEVPAPTVWTVDDDDKADFDNIQAAVDASSDGDEIVVMPGTYTSTQDGHVVNMLGKAVTLRSSDPSDPVVVGATIIDGEGVRRGLACYTNETFQTIISGFTITNGSAVGFDYNGNGDIEYWEITGGGMWNYNSSPTLTDCSFTGNDAPYAGGMHNYYSSPMLTNCTFTNNSANGAGGMLNWESNPTLTDCTFTDNTASVYGGGGMFNQTSSPTLTNCTFTGNSASSGAGIYSANKSNPTLTDTTVCGNASGQISGDWTDNGGNSIADVCPIDCTSDINVDGNVDVNDLLILIADWGTCTGNCAGDVNEDGTVDIEDLLILIAAWGPCE